MRFARLTWVVLLALAPLSTAPYVTPAAAAPEGQMTWCVHVSLVPLWFDPADAQGIITRRPADRSRISDRSWNPKASS